MKTTIRTSTLSLSALIASAAFACQPSPMQIEIRDGDGERVMNSPLDAQHLRVIVRDEKGAEIPGPRVRWSSSHPKIAFVSVDGHVTPVQNGHATITARSGYAQKSVPVTVVLYASIRTSHDKVTLQPGESIFLTAQVLTRSGTVLDAPIVWTSKNPEIAAVGEDGLVTAKSAGATTITVSAKHLRVSIEVHVPADRSS